MEGLPHLHGWKFYTWAREFFESRNKLNFLCAANQISKSSTQIRKCIDWATDTTKWPTLWKRPPSQFWYLYPSQDVVNAEVVLKWESEFLPRGEYKNHPQYGWTWLKKKQDFIGIRFNTGVHIFFKTYTKNVQHLQTGTVDAIFCFVAGTEVHTDSGIKNIEDLRIGDSVLTHKGYSKIKSVMNNPRDVISRTFSNGRTITATPDHPFWTQNRGWVQFGELTEKDTCLMLPECESSLKSSYSKEFSTRVSQIIPIIGKASTLETVKDSCTSNCGKGTTIKKFLRDTLYTIKTKTLSTIASRIWKCFHEKSTQDSTKSLSGKKEGFTPVSVPCVKKNFSLEAAKRKFLDIAHRLVGKKPMLSKSNANLVEEIKRFDGMLTKCSVVKNAQIQPTRQIVYNLELEDTHTYFANSILVHNCDEELPVNLYDELINRINATDGYFHMVFTATIGQDLWRLTMEAGEKEEEKFPQAAKWTVSLYEALFYEDGTRSHWTEERIANIRAKCKNHAEVLKRVYGRFVVVEGRKFPTFDAKKHLKPKYPLPASWLIYAGIDMGSGGEKNHPAAIVFVGVAPDYRSARVFLGWRGDGVETTNTDIILKYRELKKEHNLTVQMAYYDWASKDFEIIASRMGEYFEKADKAHDKGESLINALFKNDMMFLYEDSEVEKLAGELSVLKEGTLKRNARDDFVDALRYALSKIPFDFSGIIGVPSDLDEVPEKVMTTTERELFDRRKRIENEKNDDETQSLEEEFEEWNELYQ